MKRALFAFLLLAFSLPLAAEEVAPEAEAIAEPEMVVEVEAEPAGVVMPQADVENEAVVEIEPAAETASETESIAEAVAEPEPEPEAADEPVLSSEEKANILKEKFAKYTDEVIKEGENVIKIISPDKSYDEFVYSPAGKIIRIDSYYSTGALKEKAIFFREPETGEVLIIKKDGSDDAVYFIYLDEKQKSYVKSDKDNVNQYTTYLSSILYSVDGDFDYKYSEQGDLIITYGEKEFVYDENGRLKRDGDKHYFYTDDDIILRVDTINKKGEKTRVDNYQKGKVKDTQFYENGKLVKQVLHKSSGNIEEYYENEVKYAEATFDTSGKKVLKIEYTTPL